VLVDWWKTRQTVRWLRRAVVSVRDGVGVDVDDVVVPRYTCHKCGRKAMRATFGQGTSMADTMATFQLVCENCGHTGVARG
jgi:DNA-directed RNA polymerase subunit M/transcription elongation factor TFIIS